jgi:hypothetical protein
MRLIWERMPNSISNKMPANSNTDSNPRMAHILGQTLVRRRDGF